MRNHSFLVLGLLFGVGVFGVTDGVKSVSVKEGDPVTLHTDLTEIQTDEELQWKFPDDTIIAEIDGETNTIRVPGNERFGGRLKLDETTGSLTITNIKTTDSGVYQLQISSKTRDEGSEFSVTIDDSQERSGSTGTGVSVKCGASVVLACAAAVFLLQGV